jgi:sugar (glycoside-pentoside-hexuronide) transporter
MSSVDISKNVSADPQRPFISVSRRVGYALGDFGCNFSWTLIGSYLMFFMTDVALINAATVGTLMLISKAWDAINDPIVGTLADRTRSRWGRYRPWVLFSAIPMLIFNVMCFTTNLNWSTGFRTAWALGAYFILVLLYTMVNIPYSAMPTALTLSDVDRSKFASARMSGAFFAGTILAFLTLRVVQWTGAGNQQRGFQLTAIIFSAIALPCFIICFASQKEVVRMEYRKTPYKKLFTALKGNTPTWMCLVAYMCWGIMSGGGAAKMYYFTYNANNPLLFANVGTLQSIVGIMGTLSLTWLVGKVKNKGTLATLAFFVGGIANILCFFVPILTTGGIVLYYLLAAVNGFCSGLMLASMFGIMPDLNEFTAYYHGMYASGFLSSFINFALKFGAAVSTAAVGWALAGLGYQPNVTQTSAVLTAINFIVHVFVGLTMIVSGFCMLNYKLDKKTHADICEKLARHEFAPGVVPDEEIA